MKGYQSVPGQLGPQFLPQARVLPASVASDWGPEQGVTRVHVSIAIYRRESDGARRKLRYRTSFQLTRLPQQFGMQKPQFAALVGNPRPAP